MMQDFRRPPSIAQIFVRDKQFTQVCCLLEIATRTSFKKLLARLRSNASRSGRKARQLPIARMNNRGALADATDNQITIYSRQQRFQISVLTWILAHNGILDP